jgi:hypothetical protein
LKKLGSKEGINTEQENEIENYVKILNEMETLIVVFDVIEHSGNLKDAIATAMLNDIKYRVKNWEQHFSADTRAGELAWCMVRSSFLL